MAEFPTGRIHKPVHNYVWDTGTMAWVVETQPTGGGGGGGTVDQGAGGSDAWLIEAASLPLPTGAATEATLSDANTNLLSISSQLATMSSQLSGIDTDIVVEVGVPVQSIDTKTVQARTADYDTGAGTVATEFVGIALPASGGPVAGGTATNPVRVDPTGTTTQPVSAASLPLPTGAATAARQDTGNASLASIDGKITSSVTDPIGDENGVIVRNIPSGTQAVSLPTSFAALDSIEAAGTLTDTVTPLFFDNGLNGRPGGSFRIGDQDWSGRLVLQVSPEAVQWFDIPFASVEDGVLVTSTTKNGTYVFNSYGHDLLRFILTDFQSGNCQIIAHAVYADSMGIAQVAAAAKGLVKDTSQPYLAGEIRSLSLTTDGRLRVSVEGDVAITSEQLFRDSSLFFAVPHIASDDPTVVTSDNPWGT